MASSVAEFGFGWTDLLSLGKKRKSIDEELELNLLHCIQRRRNSPSVGGPNSSPNPFNRYSDWLSPVCLLQRDAATSSKYEKCLDPKTGRFYMVKNSASATRRRQCKATLSSKPIPSFGETQVEEEISLDLGLHLGNYLGSHLLNKNKNNNRKERCNGSPTNSTISFQEEEEEIKGNEGGGGPLYIKKGNNKSSLLGSPTSSSSSSSCSSSSSGGLVTTGCPKCLIFLMVSEEDPFCPRCGTSSLLNL